MSGRPRTWSVGLALSLCPTACVHQAHLTMGVNVKTGATTGQVDMWIRGKHALLQYTIFFLPAFTFLTPAPHRRHTNISPTLWSVSLARQSSRLRSVNSNTTNGPSRDATRASISYSPYALLAVAREGQRAVTCLGFTAFTFSQHRRLRPHTLHCVPKWCPIWVHTELSSSSGLRID